MIVKLMGLGDLAAASSLVLLNLGVGGFATTLAMASAVYLGIKGIIFFFDFASLMDIFSAIALVLMLFFDFRSAVVYLFVFWLLQKGVRSLL